MNRYQTTFCCRDIWILHFCRCKHKWLLIKFSQGGLKRTFQILKVGSLPNPKSNQYIFFQVTTFLQLNYPIKFQCCPHIETSQLIFCANQLTGFCMRATQVYPDYRKPVPESKQSKPRYSRELIKKYKSLPKKSSSSSGSTDM